ncbi:sugar transferase [Mucilaginibacter sp. JRF]|uniref:sugar transferase n=1 Tax=Mucilaginibacter sp. JRF TaxID=2780088 RepID=UPI00188195F9|nr:sugar transferase [Mucilaginibacter sp. JRF]MBE9584299.1 sugar transferase [Mucilaginibacter sp. JRF]
MIDLLVRILCFLILVLIMPLLLLLGLIIKISYPGKIFYRQPREGKHGRVFRIWKLRTMRANADRILADLLKNDEQKAREMQDFGCLRDDPRIAGSVAKLARQLSIDELPQLINIVTGDMTLVGPRPLELFLAESLDAKSRAIRNAVKPGLTGLWQVGPRSDINIRQMQFYDKLYIKKKSLQLDMYIICKTAQVVIKRTGM